MYYVEAVINGVIHYRTNPSGEWIVKQMVTPIEKVQAALERALRISVNDDNFITQGWIEEALSELKGKVLVPVKFTDEMQQIATKFWDQDLDYAALYEREIAPYVKGE